MKSSKKKKVQFLIQLMADIRLSFRSLMVDRRYGREIQTERDLREACAGRIPKPGDCRGYAALCGDGWNLLRGGLAVRLSGHTALPEPVRSSGRHLTPRHAMISTSEK